MDEKQAREYMSMIDAIDSRFEPPDWLREAFRPKPRRDPDDDDDEVEDDDDE